MAPDRTSRSDRVDTCFRALADARRRSLLAYLSDRDAPTSLDEVAEYLASEASGRAADRTRQIRTRLHHVDLPMLSEAGLVRYDRESTRVVPCDPPGDVAPIVEGALEQT